jgi:hypothetical protein
MRDVDIAFERRLLEIRHERLDVAPPAAARQATGN